MRYTNRCGLPEEVFLALSRNRYAADEDERKTDYSITTLASPVQQTLLKKRHSDNLEADVIDQVWSLFGNIAHSLLEEHGSDDSLTEKRFYAVLMARLVSGMVDHYKDAVISDYKTTSVYKVRKQDYHEWEQQLNCYAYLCRLNGLVVRNLRIIVILRDWSKSLVGPNDYPKAPIVEIPLTMWATEDTEFYIESRLHALIMNEDKPDNELLACTKEEMWERDGKWAVMKKGNKKASKLVDMKSDGDVWIAEQKKPEDYVLEERFGERVRCESYCVTKEFCHQYKNYKQQNGEIE